VKKNYHFSIRINYELIQRAKESGIDVKDLLRSTLEKALADKRCPSCGQVLKKK
jgi:post-segregation antitoxin (ccd killing protein)